MPQSEATHFFFMLLTMHQIVAHLINQESTLLYQKNLCHLEKCFKDLDLLSQRTIIIYAFSGIR